MAMSGSITGSPIILTQSGNTSYTTYCDWQVIHQDTENNASRVRVDMYVNCLLMPAGYQQTIRSTLTAGGITKTASTTFSSTGLSKVASLTIYVYHNDSGTGGFNVSSSCSVSGSSLHTTGGFSTRWVEVEAIKREAILLTAPNFNDEENPTITYSNPLGESASISAAISLDGSNPDIEYRDIDKNGTEYTFELTEEERNILRAATTGSNTRTVLFYIRSIVGDDYYFSYKEATYTVINANPIVEASVVDINETTVALTGDNTTLIRYNSTAYAAMTATAQKQADIRTYSIEHNGGHSSGETLTVENVNGNTFAFIVSDNRGNTGSKLIVSPMIDYIKPTANIDTEQKMNTNGEYLVKCAGNYFNDTFGYTDAATMNTITVQYRYKTQNGSYGSWYAMAATVDGNTYEAEAQATGFDYRQTYIFQCRIVDKLNTVLSTEITVRSIPIFHWSGDDFVFEVPVKFNEGVICDNPEDSSDVDGDMLITGNLRLKGSGNYGNTLYFGDASYCYIREITDDDLTIKASDINLNGNVYINGSPIGGGSGASTEYGTWTPTLAASNYVSSYSVQEGWYQKVGNVITIGWMIKATTKNSGIGTIIRINGAPYTPSVAAFGGGIAHNVYISGGFTFTGWTIDDSGVISAKGQSCNNTTAANHEITSTICYGTSNSLMTLSGTICYTV